MQYLRCLVILVVVLLLALSAANCAPAAGSGSSDKYLWKKSSDVICTATAISPDGTLAAYAITGQGISIVDAATGTPKKQLAEKFTPQFLKFSADGSLLITDDGNTVVFYDTKTWEARKRFDCNAVYEGQETETVALHTYSLSANGKRLFAYLVIVRLEGMAGAYRLISWDTESGSVLFNQEVPYASLPDSFVSSPDGELIAIACTDGHGPSVVDASTGKLIFKPLNELGNGEIAHFTPDGKALLVLTEYMDVMSATPSVVMHVQSIDPKTGKVLKKVTLAGIDKMKMMEQGHLFVMKWAFSHDGSTVYTSYLGKVRSWDTATGKAVATFGDVEDYMLEAGCINRDGTIFVAAGSNMTAAGIFAWKVPKPASQATDK